jgi:hypothetical protein
MPMHPRTRTQYKLEEAKFFLQLLEENWRHAPHFDYFLSAFVSAARSVTWVMRSEYGGRFPDWDSWFESKKPTSSTRDLLRRMNDLRVRATKSDPLRTLTTAQVMVDLTTATPDFDDWLARGSPGKVRLEPANESNTEAYVVVDSQRLAIARIDQAAHELPEFQGQDVRPFCQSYLAELEALCSECVSKFGPRSNP